MLASGEDDLICDFAETYGVMDFRALTPTMASVLACGLRDESRIKMKLQEQTVPLDTLLLAVVADRLGLLLWSGSKDAQHNRNRPDSIADRLLRGQTQDKVTAYKTAEEFEAAFLRLAGGG